jgi:hypothetical protein
MGTPTDFNNLPDEGERFSRNCHYRKVFTFSDRLMATDPVT